MANQVTRVPPQSRADPSTDHRYNDDLLLEKKVRDQAKNDFSHIGHVLDHRELRETFQSVDHGANDAKMRSRVWGFRAVVIALVALLIASSEPLLDRESRLWPTAFAITAAALGLWAAAIAALGVLHGARKAEWLHKRLYGERLRQFYFQNFIWRLGEIAESCKNATPRTKEEFEQARQRWFSHFTMRHDRQLDSELSRILDPSVTPEVWLHETAARSRPKVPTGFDPALLFAAYRKLRFLEQFCYVDHKLRPVGYGLNLLKLPLRVQQRVLRFIWATGVGGVLILEVAILIGHVPWFGLHPLLSWLPIGVIWFALLAMAARTLQEGLSLPQDIERYEDYRSAVRDLLSRFDSTDDNSEKLEVMIEMERVAFEEMRSFLRSSNAATFIL